MEVLQYLSVVTPAAASGSVVIRLESYDLETNVIINTTVTGIAATATCSDIAKSIYTQINLSLAAATATFDTIVCPTQDMVAKFNVTRTDQVLCIMSQCQFDAKIVSAPSGVNIDVGDNPIFLTVTEADDMSAVPEADCETGTALTTAEKILWIKRASARLAAFLRNNIVLSTYLHNDIASGNGSVFVQKRPLANFFSPAIRYKYYTTYPTALVYMVTRSRFYVGNRSIGEIADNEHQLLVDTRQPFNEGNEVIIAYTAGYQHLPMIIQECAAKFSYFLSTNGELKSESIEGISNDYRSIPEVLQGFVPFLREYRSK